MIDGKAKNDGDNVQNDEANLFARCVLKHRNIDCQINISKEGKTCFVNKIKLDIFN